MRARRLTVFEGAPKPGAIASGGNTTQYNESDFLIEVTSSGSCAMVWKLGEDGQPVDEDPILIGGSNIRFSIIDRKSIKPRDEKPADKPTKK